MSIGAQIRQMDAEAEAAARAEYEQSKPKEPLMDAGGRPTPAGWRKIGDLFQKPMPSKERKGAGGRVFDYITARQVQDRLDKVVGPGNWTTTFRVLDLEARVVECMLTVCGVYKTDVGYSNAPDSEHESEPLKAAYSDAFKRAAVQFGIGRFLYEDVP